MRIIPLALLLGLLARPAAAGPGEKALAAGFGVAALADNSKPFWGPQVAAEFLYGWSESLWLRATAGTSFHPDIDTVAARAQFGVTYAFDVVKYVPSASIGAGALFLASKGGDVDVRPVIEVGLGLDRLIGRSWSVGVEARLATFSTDTVAFTSGLRVCYRWGFF